jgi:hypothetical protein
MGSRHAVGEYDGISPPVEVNESGRQDAAEADSRARDGIHHEPAGG